MIEWIITSSALILLVLVLRLLVRERVSPRLRYALWMLVLLRLLIPGTLWESPASVMTPIAMQEARQEVRPLPGFAYPFAPDSNPYLDSVKPEVIDPTAMGQSFFDPALYTLPEKEETVDWATWLTGIWLAGTAAVGGFLLVVNLKFARNLKRKRQPAGDYRGRPAYMAGDLPTPCLFGLFRPAIYLTPEVAADETVRIHVLAHEYTHFRQWDHLWAVLRGVCLAVHWYNPLVWLAALLSRRDCELSCDEGAVRILGEAQRADYGRTLVGLVARRTTAADLACCATTMTGGKSALKERIALLVKKPRTTAVMAVLVAAACGVFAVCTFTGAAEAEEADGPADPVQTDRDPAGDPAPEADPIPVPGNSFLLEIPEDLPTELMDLSRPAEEQGEWLLLAQAPYTDASLYRRADDDQHVYLRLTNQCFQRFNRDLTGMELLPTMDLWDGEAELALEVRYRRYEGTYFNGTAYEPGIVADVVIYDWSVEEKCWNELELYVSTGLRQSLTEDLLPLANLPTWTLDTPGAEAYPIWLLGEFPEGDIAAYYEKSAGKIWLRCGDIIQPVEGMTVCIPQMILPELYFDDLDGDGERELIAVSQEDFAAGISRQQLSVYEWDGGRWTWATHDPEQTASSFETFRTYQFYDDGTAYIRYLDTDLLLDLSGLWEDGYWDAPPALCRLTELLTSYTYQDGRLTMTMGGEIIEAGAGHLRGHIFDYVCPIVYSGYRNGESDLHSLDGALRSEFAAERPDMGVSRLTPVFRRILREFIDECRQTLGGGDADISNDYFSVCDVNGDGKDELITVLNDASMAGQVERVYDADGSELLAAYPLITYYDNGYVTAGWSHNQGKAGDRLWPYDLYKYDAGAGKYVRIATVDGWDETLERGSYRSYDGEEIPYPYDVDQDGDGFVYYIITEEGGYAPVYGQPMDYAEYALWAARYLGANVVYVNEYSLSEENIALIEQN